MIAIVIFLRKLNNETNKESFKGNYCNDLIISSIDQIKIVGVS